MRDIYVSTYCNFPHDMTDGSPIDHECQIIPVEALEAERDGLYELAINLMKGKKTMCIDFRNQADVDKFNGEDVTVNFNELGDLVIHPCKSRINALLPTWRENKLTERHMYAIVEDRGDDAIDNTLSDLGLPENAREWMDRGHSVVFTCIAFETLDTLLFNYNGIPF